MQCFLLKMAYVLLKSQSQDDNSNYFKQKRIRQNQGLVWDWAFKNDS